MSFTAVTDELKRSVQEALEEAREQERRLRAALEALDGPKERMRKQMQRTGPKRYAGRSNGRGGKAKSKAVTEEAVLDALRTRGPCSAQEVASAIDGSPNVTLKRLHELVDKGQVARSGERHQTRWHATVAVSPPGNS